MSTTFTQSIFRRMQPPMIRRSPRVLWETVNAVNYVLTNTDFRGIRILPNLWSEISFRAGVNHLAPSLDIPVSNSFAT